MSPGARGAMLLGLALAVTGCDPSPRPDSPGAETKAPAVDAASTPRFVGRQTCSQCHPGEAARWQGSHHDLAMDVASEHTVLGDFDDVTFTHFGRSSRFFRRDGRYLVLTDGPDGEATEYEIAYTFGVDPLQQYLIAFPGGRYQVLGVCWDSRPAEVGGQRWFHLYPDEEIPPGDELHWTGRAQNWNFMCAECHSTNLDKGYRPGDDRYETTWSEIDVSCEACHGPGSAHVAWAEDGEHALAHGEPGDHTSARGDQAESQDRGLTVHLDWDVSGWEIDPETGSARRTSPPPSRDEVAACARCHARRSPIVEPYEHGRPLLDTHRLSLLAEPLYHSDGQIREEVYVVGSFLQSRMYAQGVTCSDCHEPHSQRLLAGGNALCARCHLPERFDVPAHHHHERNTDGALCVNCHMPQTTYMVVDPRRDHSLRIPRPDLSVTLGTPNACNGCHAERDARWAADTLADWRGPDAAPLPGHYGPALAAGREGAPGAAAALSRLVGDVEQPAIARATALSLLPDQVEPPTAGTFATAVGDADPLVRQAAAEALAVADAQRRVELLAPLLSDPVRAVRLAAGRTLAGLPPELLDPGQRELLGLALGEFTAAQLVNGDRPEHHLNLGLLALELGDLPAAAAAYQTALRLDPAFVPALVNLADLHRLAGRDADAERVLRRALELAPGDGDLQHALGLALVRLQRLDEAITRLEQAVALRPETPRYAYVLGVALHSTGATDRALVALAAAHDRHPNDRDLLVALTTISRDAGELDAAIGYASQLLSLSPQDQAVLDLLAELEAVRR